MTIELSDALLLASLLLGILLLLLSHALHDSAAMSDSLCDLLYTLIEDGKYAEAVRESQRENLRNIPLSMALRAYCLANLGKREECMDVARAVMKLFSVNDNVNLALRGALIQCHRENEMSLHYEVRV